MTPIPDSRPPWADPTATLRVAASAVVVVAGGWWLLGQLTPVLRPLLLAVFMGYVLMPYFNRLRKVFPAPIALALLGGAATVVMMAFTFAVAGGVSELQSEGPQLKARAVTLIRDARAWATDFLPDGALGTGPGGRPLDEQAAGWATDGALSVVNVAAVTLLEAATAGLYLMFLMFESARFPDRVRAAYPAEKAAHVLRVFGRINAAIISYLKAKVISSLVLAVPVGVLLASCGVRFVPLWTVATFASNFIPYLGTVAAITIPTGFAFLQYGPTWQPVVVAVGLIVWHSLSSTILEPMILGRAVGLSPLVILAALSLWGLLWGLPGMFLAVPLTVVAAIILDNIEVTKPIARLMTTD
ncbi:MAG: AI-2E family transporter [Fimbriiglobus sp.]